MQCPKCKQDIPEDSMFCQCCGVNIKEWQINSNTCPYCGKELPEDSSFCQYCGMKIEQKKQQERMKNGEGRKKLKIPPIYVFIAVAILIVLMGFIVFQVVKYQKETTELCERIEELEDANADMNWKILDYGLDINNLESKLDFYEKHVVFVDDSDSRQYHSNPECFKFDSSSFWAYNTEAAIDRGYNPCPWCCDN